MPKTKKQLSSQLDLFPKQYWIDKIYRDIEESKKLKPSKRIRSISIKEALKK